MSRDIWMLSDTHFNHSNLLNFKNDDGSHARVHPDTGLPFADVAEMNELMIKNWNDVIRPQDKVYHLGDCIMGPKKDYNSILCRLNGHKRLILGNHDQVVGTSLLDWFEKLEVWRLFKEHGFICTHIPIHIDNFRAKCTVNVHGHVHNNSMKEPYYWNICVEKLAFKPVHIDTIIEGVKQRNS